MPGLHSQEELEPLLAPLKEQMREDGVHKTTYEFFVSRVQKNLHVVLCMVRPILTEGVQASIFKFGSIPTMVQ